MDLGNKIGLQVGFYLFVLFGEDAGGRRKAQQTLMQMNGSPSEGSTGNGYHKRGLLGGIWVSWKQEAEEKGEEEKRREEAKRERMGEMRASKVCFTRDETWASGKLFLLHDRALVALCSRVFVGRGHTLGREGTRVIGGIMSAVTVSSTSPSTSLLPQALLSREAGGREVEAGCIDAHPPRRTTGLFASCGVGTSYH